MKKKDKGSLFSLTQDLKNILEVKPDKNQMIKEIEMMKLKIKPVFGNINAIDFKNEQFLETLWRLGKLDEFFSANLKKVNQKERTVLIEIGLQIKKKLESQLSLLEVRSRSFFPQLIEMEIFRETPKKKN